MLIIVLFLLIHCFKIVDWCIYLSFAVNIIIFMSGYVPNKALYKIRIVPVLYVY